MAFNQALTLRVGLMLTLLWAGTTQATSRWDILQWCSENSQADIVRCEGFLRAAVDLRTSEEFSGPRSCFLSGTSLIDVRREVVAWLKKHKTVPEQNGLALVSRAIQERFPCPD